MLLFNPNEMCVIHQDSTFTVSFLNEHGLFLEDAEMFFMQKMMQKHCVLQ